MNPVRRKDRRGGTKGDRGPAADIAGIRRPAMPRRTPEFQQDYLFRQRRTKTAPISGYKIILLNSCSHSRERPLSLSLTKVRAPLPTFSRRNALVITHHLCCAHLTPSRLTSQPVRYSSQNASVSRVTLHLKADAIANLHDIAATRASV